jgi:serine-aspartate repeat-containing protein C/D/E
MRDNLDQDFGFQPYGFGAIGDTVWRDRNADGIQFGLQEPGIANVLVTLYADFNGDGTYVLLQSTNTSSNGTYLFSGPARRKLPRRGGHADDDLPMDAFGNPYYASTPTSVDMALSGGNTDLSADFGFAPYAAIGDTIFWDSNRNGTQDTSERRGFRT